MRRTSQLVVFQFDVGMYRIMLEVLVISYVETNCLQRMGLYILTSLERYHFYHSNIDSFSFKDIMLYDNT